MKVHPTRRTVLAGMSLAALPLFDARAQAYPDKPIRLVVPSVPGGGTDAIARIVADGLALLWKQPVVIDNKPGASAIIASQIVARAPPDGYTLLLVTPGHALNPALVKSLPYDTLKDFTPVTSVAKAPYVLVASASSGVKSLNDLRALAKRAPQELMFGAPDPGMRLTAERLGGLLGAPITHVNYKGTGPMMTDLAGGHLGFSMTSIASAMPFRNSPLVNFIAVTGPARTPVVADVPTLAELGVSGLDANIWYGLVAPPGTPKAIVNHIVASVRTAMATDDSKKRTTTLAMESWVTSGDEFDAFIREDLAANLKLARQAGIEPQ